MGGFRNFLKFLKRHKNKIFLAGAVASGAYYAWTSIWGKLQLNQEAKLAAAFATAKKQTHFESNQKTCNATLNSLTPVLRESIMKELDCEKISEQLKMKPTNKVYLWSELKILAFTRTLVSVYSSCILALTLRIQLNVVGGCIYAKNEEQNDQVLSREETDAQQKYLETIQFFLTTGVRELCTLVRHTVEKELLNTSLKQALTTQTLSELITKMRKGIEKSSANGTPFIDYIRSTSSESAADISTEATISLPRLISETNDILNSEDYHVVLQSAIENGFTQLSGHIEKVFSSASSVEPNSFQAWSSQRPLVPSIALAKIIPPLVGTIHIICNDTTSQYLQSILGTQSINDLAYQIYESFCQPTSVESP